MSSTFALALLLTAPAAGLSAGQTGAVPEDLQDAVRVRPDDPEARRLLGLAYVRAGRVSEGTGQLEAAIGLAPLEESLHLVLTDIYWMLGLTSEAEAVATRAVRMLPDSQRVRQTLADLYANSGRLRLSLGEFARVSELDGPVAPEETFRKMGDAYSTLVEFDDAEAAYLKALDVDPGHVASRLGLGNVYLRSGRLSGALDQYEGILRAEPDNVTARLRLAEVHLRSGRLEESVDAANEVLRIDPADRRALYLRGTARVRLGRHDRGEADLEEFRRLETAAADEEHRELEVMSFNREAVAMVRQGRYQEAIEALEQGIEVRPDAGSLYLNLGLIRSRAGDHRGAVGTFEAMLRLGFTDDPAIHRNLTREYELLGDIDASRKHRSILLEQFGLSR